MRKLVQYALVSLDGAAEDPRRYFPNSTTAEPSAPTFDPVMADLEAEMIRRQDAVLLGRMTFDEWSGYWPTSVEQPFADFINGVTKHVVTSTPLIASWNHADALSGPVTDLVRDLKGQPGGDIGIHGSITLAQSLLAAGLVDELQLAIGPVLDPLGRRLFGGLDDLRPLELVRAIPTPSGALWTTYRIH